MVAQNVVALGSSCETPCFDLTCLGVNEEQLALRYLNNSLQLPYNAHLASEGRSL